MHSHLSRCQDRNTLASSVAARQALPLSGIFVLMITSLQVHKVRKKKNVKGESVRLEVKLLNGADLVMELVRARCHILPYNDLHNLLACDILCALLLRSSFQNRRDCTSNFGVTSPVQAVHAFTCLVLAARREACALYLDSSLWLACTACSPHFLSLHICDDAMCRHMRTACGGHAGGEPGAGGALAWPPASAAVLCCGRGPCAQCRPVQPGGISQPPPGGAPGLARHAHLLGQLHLLA